MSEIQRQRVIALILTLIRDVSNPDDLPTDNEGQLVFYTSVYRWKDGTYRDKPE